MASLDHRHAGGSASRLLCCQSVSWSQLCTVMRLCLLRCLLIFIVSRAYSHCHILLLVWCLVAVCYFVSFPQQVICTSAQDLQNLVAQDLSQHYLIKFEVSCSFCKSALFQLQVMVLHMLCIFVRDYIRNKMLDIKPSNLAHNFFSPSLPVLINILNRLNCADISFDDNLLFVYKAKRILQYQLKPS